MLHFLKLLPSNRCFVILMNSSKESVIAYAKTAIASASFGLPKAQWETVEYVGLLTPEYGDNVWLIEPNHVVASIELRD